MPKGKYQEWLEKDGLDLISGWARDGLTDKQIAKNMGISERTYYEWNKKYPQISQAIKIGKKPVDYAVENALLKSALGFTYTEETSELKWDRASGQEVMKVTKTVKKYAPPNPVSIFYWLKNRRPDMWRDQPVRADSKDDDVMDSYLDALRKARAGDAKQ